MIPYLKAVPMTALTLAMTATAANPHRGSFTRIKPPGAIKGAAAASWEGPQAEAAFVPDSLSKRFSAARLAPFEQSRRTMHFLLHSARMGCPQWSEPVVNLGDDALELQWWRGKKSLTLTIAGVHMSFLKAWGKNMQTEMDDGDLKSVADFRDLWSWLQE